MKELSIILLIIAVVLFCASLYLRDYALLAVSNIFTTLAILKETDK